MDYDDFSRMEWTVLTCFWHADKSMTTREISEMFNLNQRTVLSVVRKLIKFEILEVDNYVLSGKRLARTICPKIKEKDLLIKNFESLNIINLTHILLKRIDRIEYCDFLLELIKVKQK